MSAPNTQTTFIMRPFDWLLLVCLSLLWGSSFFWSTIALDQVPAGWIVTARLILAALLLTAAVFALKRKIPTDLRSWTAFAVLGLINNLIPFSAYTLSLLYISSSLAAVLNAFTPLSTLVLSQVFRLEDRMTWFNTLGIIFGISGVALLMLPGLQGQGWSQAVGVAFAVTAALFYAFGALYARRFKGIDPYVMAWGMICFSAVYSVPAAFIQHGWPTAMPSPSILAALFMLGAFSTALAYMGFFTLLARVGPTNSATVALILPFAAVFLGVVFLGERFTVLTGGASIVIFLSMVFIDGRIPKAVLAGLSPKS